jgi:CRISPR-associated endoribonuclease Cas6
MLKQGFEQTAPDKYQELYGQNALKEFTFSVYFGRATFGKQAITLENDHLILNISTANAELCKYLFNGLMSLRNQTFQWLQHTHVTVEQITIIPQQKITENQVFLKALSPLVVRDHNKETNKDWFYSVEAPEFLEILKRNMTAKLIPLLGDYILYDIEELELIPVHMKKTVVRFYDRQMECSLGRFSLSGKPHLLNYLVQSGIGSLTGSGFGMCEIV